MLLFIIFMIELISNSLSIRVTSLCGHPGLPPDGTLYQVNSDRIRFHDGEEVRYLCSTNFQTYPQKRKCVSGHWVGETARCGVAIDNDIELVKVFNCTDANSTNVEILNLKLDQRPNTLRFLNSFHASRIKTGPIAVYGSSCYLWQFKLKKPSMIPLMTIDFGTKITFKDSSNFSNSSSLKNDTLMVTSFVSKYRMCRSIKRVDQLNPDSESNSTFLLSAIYFRCDSITENNYDFEIVDISDTIVVKTITDYPRDVNLAAVFLAGHKIDVKTGKPECGKPETVQTGANVRESFLGISQYQYQCNESFIDITPNRPINANSAHWYSLNCSVNGQWVGQFPLCIPHMQCPGLEYLEAEKDPSVVIESIENVYFVNETYWVAGEYSQVNYACIDSEHIVVGKLNRACLKNGSWSHKAPECTDFVTPESLNTVAQSPWTLIIILTVLLLIFLSFVLLIVRKYVSKVKRELTKNKSRPQTSIYNDVRNLSSRTTYDDCELNFTDINRIDRSNVNSSRQCEAEYIELNGETTEPIYTPILPPIQ